MRAVSGGLLVVVGLLLFYLIVTGKLAAALAAFKVLSSGQSPVSSTAASDATSGTNLPATTPAPLSTLSPTQNPFAPNSNAPTMTLPPLTQPAVPTLVH